MQVNGSKEINLPSFFSTHFMYNPIGGVANGLWIEPFHKIIQEKKKLTNLNIATRL